MELFEKLLEQHKFENQLKIVFSKNKTVRFELHTPWRSNPIIYFNDNLVDKPYTRLYIEIKDGKMIYRPIVSDHKNHDLFKKLSPPFT